MKVIRLVEDISWSQLNNKKPDLAKSWKDSGLTQQDFEAQKFSHWDEIRAHLQQVNSGEQGAEDKSEEEPEEYSTVDVNSIRKAFNKKSFDAVDKLKRLFKDMRTYGKNTATNINSILDKYKFDFIKYFLECLDYSNLGDHNNLILTAMANTNAKDVLDGDRNNFVRFFNLANSKGLGINQEYLEDSDALIFNRGLYKATDDDTLEEIIQADVEHTKDKDKGKKFRDGVTSNIATGNLGQFSSRKPRAYRQQQAALDTVKSLKDKEINKFLVNWGVEEDTANKAAEQIKAKANENNNK